MSYQEDLILSMYGRGEPGLAMGNIPPGKGGAPGQPYDAPKEDPKNPYVPAPKRDLAMDDPLADYDVTDKGYFMDYNGDMYMNLDGFLFPMGQGYERGTHGELVPKGLVQNNAANGLKIANARLPYMNIDNLEDPVGTLRDSGYGDPDVMDFPSGGNYRKGSDVLDKLIDLELVNRMKINQDVANITPKDFSPPPFRYMPHIRIPAIKDAEMKHFKNFIEAMGGDTKGLTKKNKSMKVYGS